MDFGVGSYALGALAGALSTLSPCVLPLLPILLASAAAAHPRGPVALAAGLALSFALLGTVLATTGSSLGLGQVAFRDLGAALLAAFGIVLLSAPLRRRFGAAGAGLRAAAGTRLSTFHVEGVGGQFMIGAVLGLVWSPCVGPTLGAAVALASQGSHLPQIALLMALFGVGAALPLAALGFLSRRLSAAAAGRMRMRLARTGRVGRLALGTMMLLLALLIVIGGDHAIETWFVDHGPAWLAELTTRY